ITRSFWFDALREEAAVSFVADRGEAARVRIRLEAEAGLACRPDERRGIADVFAGKTGVRVADLDPLVVAAPVQVEGDARLHRGPVEKAIDAVAVALHVEAGHVQRRRPRPEVDADAAAIERHRPEQPGVVIDTGIEVVNLGRETRVLEEVQSDEREGALAVATVDTDVLAVHEPDIGSPVERVAVPVLARSGRLRAAELAHAEEAVEVSDRGWITAATLDRVGRPDRIGARREVEVK